MHVCINACIVCALMRMCIMFTSDQQYSVSILRRLHDPTEFYDYYILER